MEEPIRTKQEAYNDYARLMEQGNKLYRMGDEEGAEFMYQRAEESWDLYYYWDEIEE